VIGEGGHGLACRQVPEANRGVVTCCYYLQHTDILKYDVLVHNPVVPVTLPGTLRGRPIIVKILLRQRASLLGIFSHFGIYKKI
jgi:hypothetical protein